MTPAATTYSPPTASPYLRLRDQVAAPAPNPRMSGTRLYGSLYVPPRDGDTSVFRDGGVIVMAWEGDKICHMIRVEAATGYQLTAEDAEAALANIEAAKG